MLQVSCGGTSITLHSHKVLNIILKQELQQNISPPSDTNIESIFSFSFNCIYSRQYTWHDNYNNNDEVNKGGKLRPSK